MTENEKLIRRVTSIGNGAHVFTPRNWLGSEVILVRTTQKPLKERIMSLLDLYLENIEGVYLYGSHARGEAEEGSDIDLLIISNKKIKIKSQGCEIVCLQKNEISKAIKISPILIYSALAEAKPIINSALLHELKNKYKPKRSDFYEYINETKNISEINNELIIRNENLAGVLYSLILRLKGVFIIKSLLAGKEYSNKKFKLWLTKSINSVNINKLIEGYNNIKRDVKRKFVVKAEDLSQLINLLKSEINNLR